MADKTYFRAQAYNNAWANYRLLTSCALLPEDEVNKVRGSFFPTIIEALNHILTVDWFYVSALEGDCIGYSAFEPEVPCPVLLDLKREQEKVDARLIAVCEGARDGFLSEPVVMKRSHGDQVERADRTLLHLFQHQVHHRGQVHGMLAETDVPPPQLDEFFMGDEKEQALRRDDFAALGFTEKKIWGDLEKP